jgi:hypothetical protein
MAEWLKAHAWKACLGETLTWVRIPLSPPEFCNPFIHPSTNYAGQGVSGAERMMGDSEAGRQPAANVLSRLIIDNLHPVGQPIQAADPLSSGSSRLKAGCWSLYISSSSSGIVGQPILAAADFQSAL